MRAFAAAIRAILRAMLGVLFMPFEFVGRLFGGGGGSKVSQQEEAADVAARAAADEAAKAAALDLPAPKPMDDAVTIKRVCGRILLGKPISPGTRISPDILGVLLGSSKPELRKLADAHPDMIAGFVYGYRDQKKIMAAKSASLVDPAIAPTPTFSDRVAARIAARIEARNKAQTAEQVDPEWAGYQNDWKRTG